MKLNRFWPLLVVALGTACAHGKAGSKDDKAASSTPPSLMERRPTTKGDADFNAFEDEFGEKSRKSLVVKDPLRGYNRFMFNVNDKFYFWVGKPMTKGYNFIIPEPARVAIARGFVNLKAPVRIINTALTGHFKGTGTEFVRLLTNSTLGVGGLFDPAERWFHIKQVDADFGQTFGHWGIGPGWPIVLPILGPSDIRDGLGLIPESFATPLNPIYGLVDNPTYWAVSIGGNFNYLSLHGDEYEKLRKDAVDPYTYFRDAYLEYREKRVKTSRGEN